MRNVSEADWKEEGKKLFGPDFMKWKFVCPVCGHVATPQEWIDAGAPEGAVAFSCIGRWLPDSQDALSSDEIGKGPCNYAGGGLFPLNPVLIEGRENRVFEFAIPSAETVSTELAGTIDG